MTAVEIDVNGVRVCTAGAEGNVMACLDVTDPPPRGSRRPIRFDVRGSSRVEMRGNRKPSVVWPTPRVSVGDEITFRIVEADDVTPYELSLPFSHAEREGVEPVDPIRPGSEAFRDSLSLQDFVGASLVDLTLMTDDPKRVRFLTTEDSRRLFDAETTCDEVRVGDRDPDGSHAVEHPRYRLAAPSEGGRTRFTAEAIGYL